MLLNLKNASQIFQLTGGKGLEWLCAKIYPFFFLSFFANMLTAFYSNGMVYPPSFVQNALTVFQISPPSYFHPTYQTDSLKVYVDWNFSLLSIVPLSLFLSPWQTIRAGRCLVQCTAVHFCPAVHFIFSFHNGIEQQELMIVTYLWVAHYQTLLVVATL